MNRGDLMRAGRWPSLQQGSTAGPVTQQGALPTALGDAILEVWQSDTAADWLRSIMPAGGQPRPTPLVGSAIRYRERHRSLTRSRPREANSAELWRQFMCHPWLTMTDSPVSALVLNAASMSATSAISSTIVNSLSTVSPSITSLTTRSSVMP